MPKMGDAMTEGKVLKWKKRPGEPVAKGEPIAEIETDKVNVDIEAEEAGVLLQILVDEGKSAPIGASIAEIGAPGQKVQPRVAAPTAPPGPAPAAAPPGSAAVRQIEGDVESVPLSRIRQTIGRRMAESKQQAPHFYVTMEVGMDDALGARRQLNETLGDHGKVSVNDFVLKAASL